MEKKNSVELKLKNDFTPYEYTEYENIFKSFDQNKDGFIDKNEIYDSLHSLGYRDITEEDVIKMISEVDLNKNKVIEFSEFLKMMKKLKKGDSSAVLSKIINKEGKLINKVEVGESVSTFSDEEKIALAKVINSVLQNDEHCSSLLPLNPESNDIFTHIIDGRILCKLLNKIEKKIDERVINSKDNLNVYQMTENLNLALNTAKSLGIVVVGTNYQTIFDQKYSLILGIIWQIVKLVLLVVVNLKNHPQLIRLLKENEKLEDFLKLQKEDILLRWFNFHLKEAGYKDPIYNFSNDLKDSEKYLVLLNQLNKNLCSKAPLSEKDLTKRAAKMLQQSKNLGVESYITPKDVVTGNSKINLIFTAAIFNHCHGLDPVTEQESNNAFKLLNEDDEGTREERAYQMWINSLGIEGVYINHLYNDCSDGIVLLKVLDRIKPGCVDWKKVNINPQNKFSKILNCNHVVDTSKECKFSVVNIGGSDIHSGNKTLVLGIVWQMMKHDTLKVLGNKTESDLLNWANGLVNREPKVKSFKEKTLKNSLFFLYLMSAIEPKSINFDLVVTNKDDEESLKNNAQYAISVARKLGASIFLVWEDIKEVKSKMLMTLAAGIYDIYILKNKSKLK